MNKKLDAQFFKFIADKVLYKDSLKFIIHS